MVDLIDQINLDNDGRIGEHEFVAFLDHNLSTMKVSFSYVSRLSTRALSDHARVQTAAMVAKIMLGLGQVLSKQPDVLRSKELIEQAKKHPWLQVFSLNFGWIMPSALHST